MRYNGQIKSEHSDFWKDCMLQKYNMKINQLRKRIKFLEPFIINNIDLGFVHIGYMNMRIKTAIEYYDKAVAQINLFEERYKNNNKWDLMGITHIKIVSDRVNSFADTGNWACEQLYEHIECLRKNETIVFELTFISCEESSPEKDQSSKKYD